MIYIYINEEGRVGISNDPPTATDLHAIGDGLLQVLVAKTEASGDLAYTLVSELDDDGQEFEPCQAALTNEEGDDFHVIV